MKVRTVTNVVHGQVAVALFAKNDRSPDQSLGMAGSALVRVNQ
jgi:hypothetical protein